MKRSGIPCIALLLAACSTPPGDRDLPASDVPATAPILAGAGQAGIDPTFETYVDTNGNLLWDPGEPYDDANRNGTLDTLWMGGFGPRQPTGSHDPLTARAVALRIGDDSHVFLALDTIGFGLERVQAVKDRLVTALTGDRAIDPDRVFVASIHSHQVPDTFGVFAPDNQPGWDEAYLQHVVDGAVEAAVAAVDALRPAHLVVAAASGEGLIRDIDEPVILDPYVGILHLVSAADGQAIATMASVANHPEAAWADNTLLSADYPFFLRQKVEADLGGMALYFSADLGLMQTPVESLGAAGFERARVVGEAYADRIVAAVNAATPVPDEEVVPTFGIARIAVELQNFFLALAVGSGIVDGFQDFLYQVDGDGPCGSGAFGCVDLPAPVLRLGDRTTLLCVPAEVTPELVVGGITAPTTYESRYPDAAAEPVVKDHLRTPDRFFMGLCNSDVGYLYPKITYNMDAVFSQQHGPGQDCARAYLTGLAGVLDEVNARAEKGGTP